MTQFTNYQMQEFRKTLLMVANQLPNNLLSSLEEAEDMRDVELSLTLSLAFNYSAEADWLLSKIEKTYFEISLN